MYTLPVFYRSLSWRNARFVSSILSVGAPSSNQHPPLNRYRVPNNSPPTQNAPSAFVLSVHIATVPSLSIASSLCITPSFTRIKVIRLSNQERERAVTFGLSHSFLVNPFRISLPKIDTSEENAFFISRVLWIQQPQACIYFPTSKSCFL